MRALALLPALALSLTACDGTVELPADPAERAMSCALGASFRLVPAIQAATDGNIPAAQYGPTHFYAVALAQARGSGGYADFAKAMTDISAKAGEDNSRYAGDAYQAACAKAYPNVERTTVTLPQDRTEAALQCTSVTRVAVSALDGSVSDMAQVRAQATAALAGTRATIGEIVARQGLTTEDQFDALFSPHFAKLASQAPFLPVIESCRKAFSG